MQRLVPVTQDEDAALVIAYLPRVELSYTEGETPVRSLAWRDPADASPMRAQ